MSDPTQHKPLHILYFIEEFWPTHRQDVSALFGKYLLRYGIHCDLVTAEDPAASGKPLSPWQSGELLLCRVPHNRAGQYVVKLWHNLKSLLTADTSKYQALQVRDMSLTALFGLIIARIKHLQFYYWLSYPQSEGQIDRAKKRGLKGGMRFWFPLLQGWIGKFLLYKIVLPRADHVFVQSRQMRLDLAAYGIPVQRMTPVPMGVDTEVAQTDQITAATDPLLSGKRVVAYLGTLDRVRQIEVLFQMLDKIKAQIPNVLLVLIGDTEDAAHRAWLREEAVRLGVNDLILWTGWLPMTTAWSYLRSADVGISPFPRGFLLDSASPTKAIEYMALGLPVVVNDNPDQAQVVTESGGGLCVPLEANAFAEAVLRLLNDPAKSAEMARLGQEYVSKVRNYAVLANNLADQYKRLLSK
ncbi:glycosyltransferase [Methylomonas paludis]|uniref:Glycosyltransferase n=1 Tax=Methylomonas paludis TaxID=1173101 RepID=A0A975RA08_9GAMM|nr:glycosyltransferase [Methylomonas paludis]QWF71642.1 glycosyltransferase [Methylomonas paludis]